MVGYSKNDAGNRSYRDSDDQAADESSPIEVAAFSLLKQLVKPVDFAILAISVMISVIFMVSFRWCVKQT